MFARPMETLRSVGHNVSLSRPYDEGTHFHRVRYDDGVARGNFYSFRFKL